MATNRNWKNKTQVKCLNELKEGFPLPGIFHLKEGRFLKPLAFNVKDQLIEAGANPRAVYYGLMGHIFSYKHQVAITKAKYRYNLDGTKQCKITQEEKDAAWAHLFRSYSETTYVKRMKKKHEGVCNFTDIWRIPSKQL